MLSSLTCGQDQHLGQLVWLVPIIYMICVKGLVMQKGKIFNLNVSTFTIFMCDPIAWHVILILGIIFG